MQLLEDRSRNYIVHTVGFLPYLLIEWEEGKATVEVETWDVLSSTNGPPPNDVAQWLRANEAYLRSFISTLGTRSAIG
jgi:hypothetical protein